MRRWILVFFLALVPVAGIFWLAAAQASTASGGPLTSGQPVTATISSVGQQIQYTFGATAGGHVTFQETNFALTSDGSNGGAYLYFYEPGSNSSYTSQFFSANSFVDFVTPASGTWSVVVVPYLDSVGSLTLTFANDVATKALASGTPVTSTIRFQGQDARYTFAGKTNRHVTFQVTKFHMTDSGSGGGVYLYLYEAGSSSSYVDYFFSSNGFEDLTLPSGGTWSAALVPYSASVGSLTLTLADDVATKALTSGHAVTSTIRFQGQDARYTFAGKTNRHVTFQVTKFHMTDSGSGGGVYLYLYEAGSSSSYVDYFFSSNGFEDLTLPSGGTWSAALVPYSASVGSLTLTLADDVATKALTPGHPVTTTIRYQGQNTGYTFSASRNKNVTFKISKFHLTSSGSGGAAYLYFYEPGSSSSYTECYFSSAAKCTFRTPVRGTWKATLVPWSASVGSFTITRP